jgi:hypothetical protein
MTNFLLGMLAGTVGTVLILVAWAWADLREWGREQHPLDDGPDERNYRANVFGKRDGRL